MGELVGRVDTPVGYVILGQTNRSRTTSLESQLLGLGLLFSWHWYCSDYSQVFWNLDSKC